MPFPIRKDELNLVKKVANELEPLNCSANLPDNQWSTGLLRILPDTISESHVYIGKCCYYIDVWINDNGCTSKKRERLYVDVKNQKIFISFHEVIVRKYENQND